MKKIFSLLFIALFAVTVSTQAQGFHVIPKVGLNMSNLSSIDGKSIAGLNAGVSFEILFTERWGIEPGVLFSMQGTKIDAEKIHMDYINIPIYAKFYVVKGFNVFAGPQVGFNVRAKMGDESIRDLVKKADFGIGMGFGYQFKWGLMASINYNFGFVDVQKGTTTKNGVFQLNVGWRF